MAAKKKKKKTKCPEPAWRSGCPIATSLDLFGDRWTLLIVRDVLFFGRRSFRDFTAAGEGIASNILAERLERLECAGVVERSVDPKDGRRVLYDVTPKGFALAPVLMEMVVWAARHEATAAPAEQVRAMEQDRDGVLAGLRRQWLARRRAQLGMSAG